MIECACVVTLCDDGKFVLICLLYLIQDVAKDVDDCVWCAFVVFREGIIVRFMVEDSFHIYWVVVAV